MDGGIILLGLFYVELGTFIALGFRSDPGDQDTELGRAGEKILGTSTVSRWYNLRLLPYFGYHFVTRALPDEESFALTVRGELWIYRLGWTTVFVGMTLQLLGQGPW